MCNVNVTMCTMYGVYIMIQYVLCVLLTFYDVDIKMCTWCCVTIIMCTKCNINVILCILLV